VAICVTQLLLAQKILENSILMLIKRFFKRTAAAQTPLDIRWFKKFKKAIAFDFLEVLDGEKEDRLKEKSLFLLGENHLPSFTYPFIKESVLTKHRARLQKLLAEITQQEQDVLVKDIYTSQIRHKLLQLALLQATLQKNDTLFTDLSQKIYGYPEPAVYFSVLHDLQEKMVRLSGDPKLGPVARQLQALLPKVTVEFVRIEPPSLATFLATQKILLPYFHDLTDLVGPKKEQIYSSKEICYIFKQALKKRGLSRWRVLLNTTSKSAINVPADKHHIIIPESRKMTAELLQEILAHEVGCHVARHTNGVASGILLLGLGLEGYDRSEEGFATTAQQVFNPTFTDYSALERCLAIGLTLGLDGSPRNFRQVFEVLRLYYLLELMHNHPTEVPEVLLEKALDHAWTASVRTFRGTTGTTTGHCFTKDTIYREGNIRVWQALAKEPAIVNDFFYGKLDPTLLEHKKILDWLRSK
jgi:hypothetical protein